MDRFAGAGDPSSLPIFIVGMPRSGSTLVEQILASHPQVHAAGELLNLDRSLDMVSDARPAESVSSYVAGLDADDLRRLGQAYLASLPPSAGRQDADHRQMPGNFLYVGLIHLILPNARIIHTMRDPVDTAFRVSRDSLPRSGVQL